MISGSLEAGPIVATIFVRFWIVSIGKYGACEARCGGSCAGMGALVSNRAARR
jgi:hypothetical protein